MFDRSRLFVRYGSLARTPRVAIIRIAVVKIEFAPDLLDLTIIVKNK